MINIYQGDNAKIIPTLKVKPNIVYLDPPYNTKNKKMSFVDDYGSEWEWVTFFEARLQAIKKIIAPNAVIFVSINQNGLPRAQLSLTNMFGEDAFVGSMPRKTMAGTKTTETISRNHDYLLIYKIGKVTFKQQNLTNNLKYNLQDDHYKTRGYYQLRPLDYQEFKYVRTLDYPLTISDKTYYPNGLTTYKSRKKFAYNKDWCWLWSMERTRFALANDFLVVKNGRIYKKTYENAAIKKNKDGYFIAYEIRQMPYGSDELMKPQYASRNSKTTYEKLFSYSKNHEFLKFIFNLPNFEEKIVLDPFAGTGSSGIVANELGLECHLIQTPEVIRSCDILQQLQVNNIYELLIKNLTENNVNIKENHGK